MFYIQYCELLELQVKWHCIWMTDAPKGGDTMATHHGGKVGKAGKTLASMSSSKSAKSGAGKTLANHKASKH